MAEEAIRMTEKCNENFVDTLDNGLHYLANVLLDTKFIRQVDVDNLSIARRNQAPLNAGLLQTPIEHIDDRGADFTIHRDIASRYNDEFKDHLLAVKPEDAEKLCVTFSTGIALGGLAIKRTIQNPRRARTPKRMQELMNIFSDNTDFQTLLVDEFGSSTKSGVLRNVLDKHTNQINGMRAALTIVRAAYQQRDGIDPVSDESIRLCLDSFLQYVRLDGEKYQEVASTKFNQSQSHGIDVFSYAIPEWLIVMSFPMSSEKVEVLF